MSDRDLPSDEDELLAAELALGLLDAAERDAAEARLATDPAFAATCRRWQDYALALVDGPAEPPKPSIWDAIVRQLPANDPVPADARGTGSVRLWRAATAISALAAIVLAVVAIDRPRPSLTIVAAPPRAVHELVAVLTSKSGSVVTVSFDPGANRLVAAPTGLDLPGHVAQLWVIAADNVPRSLGVIAAGAPGVTRPPAAAAGRIAAGATLAISIEPEGGSPTGLPTGPVILTGKAVAI